MITATNEDNMIMMARYPDDYFDLVTCEIDTDYFNDGNKRLKQHQNQLKMF